MEAKSTRSPLAWLLKLGINLDDGQDIRLQKSMMVVGSLMFIASGALWGIAYIRLGQPVAGMIPLSYAIISSVSVVLFCLTRHFRFFRTSQLVLILLLPFLLMIALGGYITSSAVIFWAILAPLGAILFAEIRQAPRWMAAYLATLVLSGLLEPYVRSAHPLSPGLIIAFFVLNLGAVSTIVFVLMHYFVGQKELAYGLLRVEQQRSESLLLNILPGEIAGRLKGGERVIADYHPEVSILFADLVGFTPLVGQLSPGQTVTLLNEIYTCFDTLVEKFGLEKIRTMGDSYMVASGLPAPRRDHAQVLARLALEMNAAVANLSWPYAGELAFRIGINSGPVIAGVIGYKKFTYDVWGDTVNIASRMESHGLPGKVQISPATYDLIKDDFVCEPQGIITVKGKGEMATWILVREADPSGEAQVFQTKINQTISDEYN